MTLMVISSHIEGHNERLLWVAEGIALTSPNLNHLRIQTPLAKPSPQRGTYGLTLLRSPSYYELTETLSGFKGVGNLM